MTGRRAVGWALAVLLSACCGGESAAQLPHLDAMPWFTPADSTSRLALVVDLDRHSDQNTDWTLNRFQLTALLPAGGRADFFLRMGYMAFDTRQTPVGARWPAVLGPAAGPDWPGERRIDGFSPLEVGATGPVGIAALGPLQYAVALGLPTGTNRLYPWSSTSLPLRAQLRRDLKPSGPWHLWLRAGYLLHMDAAGDVLASTAFPDGWQLGLDLAVYRGVGRRWHLTWDYDSRATRRSQLVGARVWFPWTRSGSLGVKVARELQGTVDRPAAWYFTLSWRLDNEAYRPGAPPQPDK